MGFAAQHVVQHPPWDSKTDEVVVALAADATGTTVIPAQCEYIIISTDNGHTSGVFISPDNTDIDSGIQFFNDAADSWVGLHVRSGVTISFHNPDGSNAIGINIVRFYNTPT